MQFIKAIASFALSLGVLSACSFVPTNQSNPSSAQNPVESKVVPTAESIDPSAPQASASVNPYLSQRPNSIPNGAKSLFESAVQSLEQNKLAAAESQFTQLSQEHPTLSGPWLNLGLIHQRTDRPESAQAHFERALAANKTNLDAYNQLGILLREQGKFTDAEQQYLKALSVWPDHPASHRNLGILYDLYLGRLESALKHYERAQTLEPKKPVRGWIADIKRRISTATNKAEQ